MEQVTLLRSYGLFDAKVPRYTSYPPANRFEPGFGATHQDIWLDQVGPDHPVSLYVHIPFCRRLCWFCACRTQGTQTLGPVEGYMAHLLREIDKIAQEHLPPSMKMARLHLGGGTPTLLSPRMMTQLLDKIHSHFTPTHDFEFSVEIDPTEAAPEVLRVLSDWGMQRASIGVQDFSPKVQEAIGRIQGLPLTNEVVNILRGNGVQSLNVDLLFGLPYQTAESLVETLDRVIGLRPDRIALYGYAHVPHVSKRQVMIPEDALPGPEARFIMSQIAKERLEAVGYDALGIDHFALPHDSLATAAKAGRMGRNFQGYTDDPCETLIGFGASAISKFRQGYLQNAVSTSAYHQRVKAGGLAAHKGYPLSQDDRFVAALIDQIMCKGEIDPAQIAKAFPDHAEALGACLNSLTARFSGLLVPRGQVLSLPPAFRAAARLIAAHLDAALHEDHQHSIAV